MSRVLEIKLSGSLNGEKVRPETFGISDLILILNGILTAVKAETPGGQFADQAKPRLLALRAIRPGSTVLEIEYDSEAAGAVDRITSALADRDMTRLTKPAQKAVRDAFGRIIKGGAGVQLLNGKETSVFTQANPIPAPAPPAMLKEETSLLAHVLKIGGGGRHSVIRAKFYATNQELTFPCARAIAKRMSDWGCLFDDVSLDGVATWRVEPWHLVRFRVKDFVPHRKKPASQRFDSLADKFGPPWNNVDPDEYMTGVRGGDTE